MTPETTESAEETHSINRPRVRFGPLALLALVAVALVMQIVYRVWLLGHARPSSDEGVVALEATGILHGQFHAFFWGQNYGGVEPWITAVFFAIFPHNATVLHLEVVSVACASGYVIWRLGKRILGDSLVAGAVVALAMVFPTSNIISLFTAYGFRDVTYFCVFAVLLICCRIAQGWDRCFAWILLGAIGGVGWWSSPEIAYGLLGALFFLPGPLLRLGSFRGALKRVGLTVLAFLVGSLPWWWVSFHTDFATLQGSSDGGFSLWNRISIFFHYVLPMQFGLRQYYSGAVIFLPHRLFQVLVLVILVALIASIVAGIKAGGIRRSFCLVTLFTPVIYVVSPATGFWQDGRYAIYLAPILWITLAIGAQECFSWQRIRNSSLTSSSVRGLAAAALVCVLAWTLWEGHYFYPSFAPAVQLKLLSGYSPNVGSSEQAQALHDAGVTTGWADYWWAYSMDMANSSLVISPVPVNAMRNISWGQEVARNPNSVWLVSGPATSEGTAPAGSDFAPGGANYSYLSQSFKNLGVTWTTQHVGDLWVLRTSRPVLPSELGMGSVPKG